MGCGGRSGAHGEMLAVANEGLFKVKHREFEGTRYVSTNETIS